MTDGNNPQYNVRTGYSIYTSVTRQNKFSVSTISASLSYDRYYINEKEKNTHTNIKNNKTKYN